jgi:hypothetical protein
LEASAVAPDDEKSAILRHRDAVASERPKDWSALLAPHLTASPEFMTNVEKLPLQERAFFGKPMGPSCSPSPRRRRKSER